jgi:hypothetical protein
MKGKLKRKEKEQTGGDNPVIPLEEKKESSKTEGEKSSDTLVFLEDRRKKKIDHTITTPDKYVSRYHYDSKNLDKYLELCPHCRKPTLEAYRKTVTDSALNYLEERSGKNGRRSNRKLFVGLIAGGLVFSSVLYYLLFHVLSGVRI